MEKEIWIAEAGEYSDYRVLAAFTTEERAQEYVNTYNEQREIIDGYLSYRASVSTLRLDPVHEIAVKCFEVRMHRDGSLVSEPNELLDLPSNSRHSITLHNNLFVRCVSETKEQAIKIANEKRAQLIASNKYPIE